MAAVIESDLKAAVKMGKLDNLYYFYGKDIAAVENFRKMVVSKAVKKGDETYNLQLLPGVHQTDGFFMARLRKQQG